VPYSPRQPPLHPHNNEEASEPGLIGIDAQSLRGLAARNIPHRVAINPFKTITIGNVGSMRRFRRAFAACLRAEQGDFGALRGEAAAATRDDGARAPLRRPVLWI
jgi:hypothetical protein